MNASVLAVWIGVAVNAVLVIFFFGRQAERSDNTRVWVKDIAGIVKGHAETLTEQGKTLAVQGKTLAEHEVSIQELKRVRHGH